jgi:hypothetical protein
VPLAFCAHILLLNVVPVSSDVEMPYLAKSATSSAYERAFGLSAMLDEILWAVILFATALLHAHQMRVAFVECAIFCGLEVMPVAVAALES